MKHKKLNKLLLNKKFRHWSSLLKINGQINKSIDNFANFTLGPIAASIDILKHLMLLFLWIPSLCCFLIWLALLPIMKLKDSCIEKFGYKYFGIKDPTSTKIKQFHRIKKYFY